MVKKALPGHISPSYLIALFVIAGLFGCNTPESNKEQKKSVAEERSMPDFNADSAYAFTKAQVDFGPRVPGTPSHQKCGDYLTAKLRLYGFEVVEQNAPITTYDHKRFTLRNIIGSYNPSLGNRVLLLAHWDTRPFASRDSVDKQKPADGANDGASGVAVLLEIARQVHLNKPEIGLDIFFDDLEDYGQEENSGFPEKEDTWCLGTQYWAAHPHKPNYTASYGILLDMVGGENPLYSKEGHSVRQAPFITDRIWNTAARLGYGDNFVDKMGPEITDDHTYINKILQIPTADIIALDPNTGRFPFYHHCHSDNMKNVSRYSLEMTGKVLVETIFSK